MYDADRPIENATEDRLNRAVFAKYLARCILDHKDPDSLVVGLYGGWGVGKTSIINMALEELNFASSNMLDEEKPIILNFSPWSYSGQDQLIYSFFRRLSSALRGATYLENSQRIIHLLELYVSFFTHKPIPRPLRSKRTWWEKITFQGREEVYAWESGRDLTMVKAELNDLLYHQQHKIIIIVDNISRLLDIEIKQVFQIVKSIGDYANTVYLLSLDKEHVIQSLNRIDQYKDGKKYIEKIVQLPFNIPPIQHQDLEAILADKLNHMIQIVPEDTWSNEYWSDLFYSSLKYIFKNCRDITRYVNTLNFGYSRLRDVVNPVDFFALTAIEVFSPETYFGIRENKDLFTDLMDNVYMTDKEKLASDKLRCDEILGRSDHIPKEVLLELLIRLFPRLRRLYYPDVDFYHSESSARKLRRICNPDMFDAYFRLSMQAGKIDAAELEMLLAIASDAESFDHMLSRLNQDWRIIKFLDSLDSHVLKTIPRENIQAIVSALLDSGDLFPIGIKGPLSLDTPMRIHRIIHQLITRISDPEDRFIILQNAIANATKSIYIIVHELREQSREHLEESDTYLPQEYRDLTAEGLISLHKLTVNRIKYWADHGSLIDHPKLLDLLRAWRDWGDTSEASRYVEQLTNTDRGLVAFLSATMDGAITQAMTKYEKNPTWEIYLDELNSFIAADKLEAHAKLLFEDNYFEKLREREQLAIMIFLDLIKSSANKTIPKTTV